MQSSENSGKKCHRFWLPLRHAVILISNVRTSASKKINFMALIRTLTISTTTFERMKEEFYGFRQTVWRQYQAKSIWDKLLSSISLLLHLVGSNLILAFFQEFFQGGKSIVMQISFVMLLFSDQISGGGKSLQGQTASGGVPLPPCGRKPRYRLCAILPNLYCICYFCEVPLQEIKKATTLIKPFPYNHSVSDVSAGLSSTRRRDSVKVKAKTSIFVENLTRVPLKLENLKSVDFHKIVFFNSPSDLFSSVIVVWNRFYTPRPFSSFAKTKMTNAVALEEG